jgi:hypothetical protein
MYVPSSAMSFTVTDPSGCSVVIVTVLFGRVTVVFFVQTLLTIGSMQCSTTVTVVSAAVVVVLVTLPWVSFSTTTVDKSAFVVVQISDWSDCFTHVSVS